ncbi:hypothetical protein [Mycolicibacterium llatzerense]|uniref:hypothetical protein n=2 Tax=Mycolicibacterium llatzerense TaxID=280871 RepID=UPI0031CEA943
MNGSVVPWIRRLALPERGPSVFFDANAQADQWVADRERLVHELAVKDEEIAELKCRVEELEAEAMEAAGNYRRPVAQSIVRGVRS